LSISPNTSGNILIASGVNTTINTSANLTFDGNSLRSSDFQFIESSQSLKYQLQLGYINSGNLYYPLFYTGSAGSYQNYPGSFSVLPDTNIQLYPGCALQFSNITARQFRYVWNGSSWVASGANQDVATSNTQIVSNAILTSNASVVLGDNFANTPSGTGTLNEVKFFGNSNISNTSYRIYFVLT
jgi:hypothetical protein